MTPANAPADNAMTLPDFKGQALRRMAGAVLILSLLLGGLDYWFELERIDDTVVRLAQREAHQFVDRHLRQDTVDFDSPALRQAVREELLRNFPIVEFYDRRQAKRLEVIATGKEWVEDTLKGRKHGFPRDDHPIYYRIDVAGHTFIQALIPLRFGIFEGVYQVDPAAIEEIHNNVLRSVLTAILAVMATGILLYTIILSLHREVVRGSRRILAGNIELMEVLGGAIAKRDSDTHTHNYRVTLYAIELARAAGVSDADMRALVAGAFLHDVGKIGIPDAILLKPGKLDETEFETMKTHVTLGSQILEKSTWLTGALDVVRHHHEKYDGSGYMLGLRGEAIPLAARIFAIVDVFDALTSRRPYKDPMPLEDALAILRRDAGSHFDPGLVARFEAIAPGLHDRLKGMNNSEVEDWLRREAGHYFGLEGTD